jgi:heavy metal translocating P-type ATPase
MNMKRIVRFLRQYSLFSLALAGLIIALLLQFTNHSNLAHWVLAVVASIELLPLVWKMWQDFRSGTYGIDLLAASAILTAIILKEYWAAMVVVLMLTGGESLEDFAEHRARSELDSLLARAPQKATVVRKGKMLTVTVDELKIGDTILIKPGELVPADAVITEGAASFDESSLTGESLPQAKDVNDNLLSGSVNLDGAVTAKVTSLAADSQYQRIVKLVRTAAASQAPFVRLADRYSIPFTFFAYALAVSAWVFSGSAVRFLEVIIVATPCPLILAAPIALISGMARASKYGIIVKTGSALERLAQARYIAFDKTGTLTKGLLQISAVTTFGSFTESEVLSFAASLEQNSNHVVAQAILEAAKEHGLKPPKAKHVKEIAGRGLSASYKGRQVLVGRFNLLEEHGVNVPAKFKRSSVKQTAVYVAIDHELAGVITFSDEVRPEAKATLELLHRLGLRRALMITGDNHTTAEAVADQLGIDEVHAEMLPADKLRVLHESKRRPMIFVGDGVNDAPILTAADVGIALGARGSAVASESADVVIMLDDLTKVASARHIARRTFQIARQSILIGIGISVGLMLIYATGKFSPLSGAIIQEVVDVIVIFNALRAHLVQA